MAAKGYGNRQGGEGKGLMFVILDFGKSFRPTCSCQYNAKLQYVTCTIMFYDEQLNV